MNPTTLSLDQDLACIPFIDDTERAGLKDELSTYLSKVADLDDAYNPHITRQNLPKHDPIIGLSTIKWSLFRWPLPKESFHSFNVLLEINRTTLFRIM